MKSSGLFVNKMYTPLYSKILAYKNYSRFHMPGHSGKDFFEFKDNHLDISEISGMDNLLAADGVIKEAEELIAKAYGYKHSLMLTQGSTSAMQIAAYTIKPLVKKVIAYRKMHSSFYNAMRLFNIDYVEVDNFEKLQDVISFSKDKYAIFTTSPTYFGNIENIDRINEIKKDNYLIVDAAHAAHFPFSSYLPKYPLGDIVFSSMHKTTPAKGGSAIINVNDDYLYELLFLNRSIIHSTSPSYEIMASMDLARAYMEENGESEYKKIKDVIVGLGESISSFRIEKSDDISRLTISKENLDAYDMLNQLHDMGIECEMAYKNKLVFILTPFNYLDVKKIENALKNVTPRYKKFEFIDKDERAINDIANLKPFFVDLDEAEGCIANAQISIYPPNQPIINFGEKITREDINILKDNLGHVLGLVNNKVPVLK